MQMLVASTAFLHSNCLLFYCYCTNFCNHFWGKQLNEIRRLCLLWFDTFYPLSSPESKRCNIPMANGARESKRKERSNKPLSNFNFIAHSLPFCCFFLYQFCLQSNILHRSKYVLIATSTNIAKQECITTTTGITTQ